MGYTSALDRLCKAFLKEAIREHKESVLPNSSNQCLAWSGSWYCTRPGHHDGPHIALKGDTKFLQLWDVRERGLGDDAIGIIADAITKLAAGEWLAIEDSGEHCFQHTYSGVYVCTRGKEHKGFHVALQDGNKLLDIWAEDDV